jgi:signal transduction histidine kinase
VSGLAGAEWLDLALGLLQLMLAAVVLRHLRGFGRAFPWLGALMVFFALRGTQRVYAAFTDGNEQVFGVVGDLLLLVVLTLLVVGLERTVRGLRYSADVAAARAEEYERALRDYRRLARHRLANPLAVVRGGAATLRELELDEAQRAEIVRAIEEAALELEQITLQPEPERPEERGLRPRPEFDQPPG